ncbi:endonuclease III domain-containing protein [Candidatus Saccharibacteria bacterium]|nr:endonuclease III domain-containing protein [Candidatus Saccharibacteria bacterium]NIV04526.1 endonuclease III domain-containing protein [Calditrichia bacterium]NIS39075.1 endonuclease III domain-containing protein [Candidatus Saccharibacteria bacterium]NIV73131.1 endonuclease III domain-containing protein [Calditrichia bacterium]NIW00464.1 endonuclease III domain-containing protein [Candidatus Saccharibacteria bacterium]
MRPLTIYKKLYKHFGPQHWWPVSSGKGDKGFEICVGVILTQNTNWQNVEMALKNLIKERLLTPCALAKCPMQKLQRLIKPSGYFRQKAKKLKIFTKYICDNYNGDTKKLLQGNLDNKREELLSIWGLGPESVDSMLLYAGAKPTFMIDAYTVRLCRELGIKFKDYEDYREYFQKKLPKSAKLYNEFHALIVAWGKVHSKNRKAAISLVKK